MKETLETGPDFITHEQRFRNGTSVITWADMAGVPGHWESGVGRT